MGRRRRKRKSGSGTIAFLSLIIIAGLVCLFFLGKDYIKEIVENKVTEIASEQITEQALEGILNSMGDPEAAEKAKEIIGSMDEEDKEQIEDIVGKYVNTQTVSDVLEMAGEGINEESLEQAKEYLKENISEEDIEKLEELYRKYGTE